MLLVHKCTHEINPTGKFPKGKRVRFTSEASIWKCFVRLRQKRSNIYTRELPTLYFGFNWKNNLLAKRVGTNIARATAKTYNGDGRVHNVGYR